MKIYFPVLLTKFIFTLSACISSYANISTHIFDTPQDLASYAADITLKLIEHNNAHSKPTVLGLATGSTPIPFYQELIRRFRADPSINLSNVITFNLDEYVGIPSSDPNSYHSFMFQYLFLPELLEAPRGFKKNNIHFPDPTKSPKDYDALIQELGPIDIQILGIGNNAHIAFNEPGTPFDQETSIIPLTAATRQANARFFNDIHEVPTHAITMGIATILNANKILLLATGKNKAQAVYQSLQSQPSYEIPASALQSHPNTYFLIDREAASYLED